MFEVHQHKTTITQQFWDVLRWPLGMKRWEKEKFENLYNQYLFNTLILCTLWLYIGHKWKLHVISSVQLLSRVWLFATLWIVARQASLSITSSWSSLRLTSIELVMPSCHLILCRPLFLLPPIPPSIRVFSNESTLHMRWPKYWSFSFSIYLITNWQGR